MKTDNMYSWHLSLRVDRPVEVRSCIYYIICGSVVAGGISIGRRGWVVLLDGLRLILDL